jgi:O-methyltransferase involved in polyketide biosynthesis
MDPDLLKQQTAGAPHLMSSASAQADNSDAVGYTSQITAAFRAVELAHSIAPVIQDPLALHLGKAAWQTAFNDWYASADITVHRVCCSLALC